MSILLKLFSNPPPPAFTPSSLIDLSSKVYILSSVSPTTIHLVKILYNLHATVYVGCSSPLSFDDTTTNPIKHQCPNSKGALKPFIFDPQNLSSIKSVVETFTQNEWRLDVLFLASDILASFQLATLLLPHMHKTASHFCHPNPSIRVVWIANLTSTSANAGLHKLCLASNLGPADVTYLLAYELSCRPLSPGPVDADSHAHTLPNSNPSGVQHVVVVVMTLGSGLQRSMRSLVSNNQETEYAAYTLLYAGLAPDVRARDWIVPWGRKANVPEHVRECVRAKDGEGQSISMRVYECCEIN